MMWGESPPALTLSSTLETMIKSEQNIVAEFRSCLETAMLISLFAYMPRDERLRVTYSSAQTGFQIQIESLNVD